MLVLTKDALLTCAHGGVVGIVASQDWVTIGGSAALVEPDPLNRPIAACPMMTPTTPPCLLTVSVDEKASYSAFVTIDGHRLCLDGATGRTDWSKLSTVPFAVGRPGQDLVSCGG